MLVSINAMANPAGVQVLGILRPPGTDNAALRIVAPGKSPLCALYRDLMECRCAELFEPGALTRATGFQALNTLAAGAFGA